MLKYINEELKYSRMVKLGASIIFVRGNKPLDALDIMSDKCLIDSADMEYDFQIVFYTCSINSDIYKKSLGYRSNTVRNDYFNKGYYVCDHFGRPINVVNEENITIIFGEDFSRIFWSYLVKYLMQIWSINNSALFVKCAAFSTNKKGTILIGCGGSGKTMINIHVCANGAQFITNSNAYIKNGNVMGIGSKMRVRMNKYYKRLFNMSKMKKGFEEEELLIDPLSVFSADVSSWTPIHNIVIVNYQNGNNKLVPISSELAFAYSQQFLLGINVYRLEEDVLNYFHNDVMKFADNYSYMTFVLKHLVETCQCYLADIDIDNKEVCNQFMEML